MAQSDFSSPIITDGRRNYGRGEIVTSKPNSLLWSNTELFSQIAPVSSIGKHFTNRYAAHSFAAKTQPNQKQPVQSLSY
jgi:hypothetical protein